MDLTPINALATDLPGNQFFDLAYSEANRIKLSNGKQTNAMIEKSQTNSIIKVSLVDDNLNPSFFMKDPRNRTVATWYS